MATRAQLIAEALTWLETPWHHRQYLKGVGTDCVRLFEGVCKSLGMLDTAWQPPIYSPEYHLHSEHELVQEILVSLGATPVPISDAQPADLLLFQFGRSCAHMAMLLPQNQIIHAVRLSNKVLINTLAGEWKARLRYAYQLPGVTP